jgi:hypothetical protein
MPPEATENQFERPQDEAILIGRNATNRVRPLGSRTP